MRIKHHIGENDKTGKLRKLFEKYSIKYKLSMKNLVTADVYEDDDCWEEIQRLIIKNNMPDIIELVFNKKELRAAEWLRLRSGWYWGYPKPEMDMGFEKVTYNDLHFCKECGSGLIQKAPFRLKGEPGWGKKAILQLNWVYDELFSKPEVFQTLQELNITGISSLKVVKHSNDTELKTIKQFVIEKKLSPGLNLPDNIIPVVCKVCGITKYQYSPRHKIAYKKEVFSNASDFNKTTELFGAKGNKIAIPLMIVSNKVYKSFEKNKWIKGIFEPIDLV